MFSENDTIFLLLNISFDNNKLLLSDNLACMRQTLYLSRSVMENKTMDDTTQTPITSTRYRSQGSIKRGIWKSSRISSLRNSDKVCQFKSLVLDHLSQNIFWGKEKVKFLGKKAYCDCFSFEWFTINWKPWDLEKKSIMIIVVFAVNKISPIVDCHIFNFLIPSYMLFLA